MENTTWRRRHLKLWQVSKSKPFTRRGIQMNHCATLFTVSKTLEAAMVFTGDTLFAGSVGRTDLYGKTAQTSSSRKTLHQPARKVVAAWRSRTRLSSAWRRKRLRKRHKRNGTNHFGIREENQPVPAT